jgi:hypothetical protein
VPPETPVVITTDDDLRSLRAWLVESTDLRGRIQFDTREPAPGELAGGAVEALIAVLAPGVLAGVVSWIRHRSSDIAVKITRADGTCVELSGSRLRRLAASELAAEIERLDRMLDAPAEGPDGPDRSGPDRSLPG